MRKEKRAFLITKVMKRKKYRTRLMTFKVPFLFGTLEKAHTLNFLD
jgi:hypothetical protein